MVRTSYPTNIHCEQEVVVSGEELFKIEAEVYCKEKNGH